MRRISTITLFVLTVLTTHARSFAAEPSTPYPLWDTHELIADYAKRVNLPPTKTLDLGNGVKLDLVLVPAGKFIMGTPMPAPVDNDAFQSRIIIGQALLAFGSGLLLELLGTVFFLAARTRQRPKISLARLLAVTVSAGLAVMGALHWRQSLQDWPKALEEFKAAESRHAVAVENEKPAHAVTLTRPFYMGKFTVTQEQYKQIMGATPASYMGNDYPVVFESWNDAQQFCQKLTRLTNQPARLPTEAEWEFACRAGATTACSAGDLITDLNRVAWNGDNSTSVMPVGQKEPNAFQLYDMHGNVWQWCQDRYGPYDATAVENPSGSKEGGGRILRGCFWSSPFARNWSAFRTFSGPDNNKGDAIGFRIAINAE